jgi:limonene-1,2-epoxide hydrolase
VAGNQAARRWHEIPIMGVRELGDTGKVTLMRDYFDSKLAL